MKGQRVEAKLSSRASRFSCKVSCCVHSGLKFTSHFVSLTQNGELECIQMSREFPEKVLQLSPKVPSRSTRAFSWPPRGANHRETFFFVLVSIKSIDFSPTLFRGGAPAPQLWLLLILISQSGGSESMRNDNRKSSHTERAIP